MKTKKFTATVRVRMTAPASEAPITFGAVEAPHPAAAARIVADRVAKTIWGGKGVAPYVAAEGGAFVAAVGEFSVEGVGASPTATRSASRSSRPTEKTETRRAPLPRVDACRAS